MLIFFGLFRVFELPLELLAATIIFGRSLEKRSKKPWAACILSLAVLWGLFVFICVISLTHISASSVFIYLFGLCTTAFGTATIFTFWWRNVNVETALYCATLAYVTQHIGYCLCNLFMPDDDVAELTIVQNWLYVMLVIIVYTAVYTAASVLVAEPLFKNGLHAIGLRSTLATMIITLGISLGFSLVVHLNSQPENILYQCCMLYAIFCCVLILWSQVDLHNRLSQQHELDLQRQLWLRHKAQYERASAAVKLINHKCHDLKRQLGAFEQLAQNTQNAETRAAIQEMEKTVSVYDSIVETGNEILDTILSEKSLQCAAQGIVFTCVADGRAVNFIEAIDLFSLLGNALDNAVEAVLPLNDADKRAVSVSIFSGQGISILQVENYYTGTIVFENGLPITGKSNDGYPGFGLQSIRRTAEKYGGVLTIRAEDEIFLLRVTLPCSRRTN